MLDDLDGELLDTWYRLHQMVGGVGWETRVHRDGQQHSPRGCSDVTEFGFGAWQLVVVANSISGGVIAGVTWVSSNTRQPKAIAVK